MLEGLLWIFGSYGLCIALVHLFYIAHVQHRNGKRTFVWMTRNNQSHIEWYIRSLSFVSWLKGREIDIYIVDEGSTDDTLEIVRRLMTHSGISVHIVPAGKSLDQLMEELRTDSIVMVKLSDQERMVDLPLFD